MKYAGEQLGDFVMYLHTASPSGAARLKMLKAMNHPYGWGGGGFMQGMGEGRVGRISGKLATSLKLRFDFGPESVTATSLSTGGVPYARFVYSPNGTQKMIPRGVIEAANDWAFARMVRFGVDVRAFQMRII